MRTQTFERDSVMLTINTDERRGHVVVFNYGAAVASSNVPQSLGTGAWMRSRRSADDTIPDGFQPVEDYKMKGANGRSVLIPSSCRS